MKFVFLIIGHLLGDFYFQSAKLVSQKRSSFKYQIWHSLLYCLCVLPFIMIFANFMVIIVSLVILFISHLLIDFVRIKIETKKKDAGWEMGLFFLDQILHLAVLYYLSTVLSKQGWWFFDSINMKKISIILLGYMIVLTPASIVVKHFTNYVQIKTQTIKEETSICEVTRVSMGAIIGMLERILIVTFGIMGLYSSIPLILAAKSIARFKQLDDKNFAEIYLVGTLLSYIIAILCVLLIKVKIWGL